MKNTIKILSRDGCEAITLNEYDKYNIENFAHGDDAIYGTIFKGAFIEEVVSNGTKITITFEADSAERVLKSTK